MRLDLPLVCLVAVAWLPANHYYPWGSAWHEGMALLGIAAGAASLRQAAQQPKIWLVFLLVALASLVIQLALRQILFVGDGWMVSVYLLAFSLALAVGSSLVDEGSARETHRLDVLCTALVLAALASVGIGLAQWLGVQNMGIFGVDLGPGKRPSANFGQPNHWCTASFVGLGAAWALFESRRIGCIGFALVAAMLLLAMVMSGSRTAWLQLGLGFGLVLLLRQRALLRLRPQSALLALAAFAVAWVLWPLLNADATPGLARSVATQVQAGVRLPMWQAMLVAIAERPWAGYGWQQMVLAQQAVALDGPPLRIHFEHAHNLLLDLMIWTGVPVGLSLAGLAGWALLRLVSTTHDARAAGLLMATGGVLAHSMVEFAIEYAYFLLPMGLLLGAAHRLARPPEVSITVPRGAMRAGGAVLLLMLAFTGRDYLQAEQSYRMLRLESARIGTSRVESPPPDLRVLTQLEAFLTFARQEPRAGASADELEFVSRVAARFAYPPSQYRLARWQALNGDAAGAARTLQTLCAMHPPAHCRDAAAGWAAAAASEPDLRAVPVPQTPH